VKPVPVRIHEEAVTDTIDPELFSVPALADLDGSSLDLVLLDARFV